MDRASRPGWTSPRRAAHRGALGHHQAGSCRHLHDPDGHGIRFCALQHHTEPFPARSLPSTTPGRRRAPPAGQHLTTAPGQDGGGRTRGETMHPGQIQELANAPIACPRRQAERDPVACPARQARQAWPPVPGQRIRPPPPRTTRLDALPAACRTSGSLLPMAAQTYVAARRPVPKITGLHASARRAGPHRGRGCQPR